MPQVTASQLIFSGLCGILWYDELQGTMPRLVWSFSAVCTLLAMVLLGGERAG
jgi:glucose uptake protein GlcU